ncbi:hypothetical protein EOK76_g0771 [Lacticaseibacillus paracasei]|nr:hypothetical protein EOK76_g0771 [Lacticaseibacillus paracasei]
MFVSQVDVESISSRAREGRTINYFRSQVDVESISSRAGNSSSSRN